jgi:hypothetical protein
VVSAQKAILVMLPFLEMVQPDVNNLYDPMQVGAPHVHSVIEIFIESIESRVHVGPQIAKARIINEYSNKYGDGRNANRKSDLNSLIGHRFLQNTPSYLRPQGAISC